MLSNMSRLFVVVVLVDVCVGHGGYDGPLGTWFRMYTEVSSEGGNNLTIYKDGSLEWYPWRDRHSDTFHKGSEILVYLDDIMTLDDDGDTAEVNLLMSAWGKNEKECGDASPSECDHCTKKGFSDWRCMAGTGDFRMAMMDSNGGGFVSSDGYGYRNSHFPKYRGLEFRFDSHVSYPKERSPDCTHTCKTISGTARDNFETITGDEPETLTLDPSANNGDSNPFDHQIYGSDGQDLTCCDQYAWTKPIPGEYLSMKMKRRSKTKFDWEFHLTGDKHSTTYDFASYHDDGDKYTLKKVDTFVIGYPNSRGYYSLKLAELGSLPCYLTQQTSKHPCQPGKTFGCDGNGTMWVTDGCAGEFVCSYSTTKCESEDFDKAVCQCGNGCTVSVVEQKSSHNCTLHESYGCHDNGMMWVNHGCEATFECNGKNVDCKSSDFKYNTCNC